MPICNSYGGSVGQPRQRSDEHLTEGSPRHLAKDESIEVHCKSEDEERDEGALAVVPTINNLSASRFNELKQVNGAASVNSLSTSVNTGSRKLRRGSLVMGDKAMKRCISLRVSLINQS